MNEVIEAPASAGQRFINGGRARHAGVEAATHVSWPGGPRGDVLLMGAYTYLPLAEFRDGDRRAEIVGNRVPYAPRHLWSASAEWRHALGLSVGMSWEHTGAQFADPENTLEPSEDGQEGILPAYGVAHAFAAWSLRALPVRFRLSVRNLFDRTYITQRSEGIWTGMSRFVRAEAEWRP